MPHPNSNHQIQSIMYIFAFYLSYFSKLADVSTLSSNPQSTVLQRKDDTHQIPPFGVDQDILSYSVQELDSPTFGKYLKS